MQKKCSKKHLSFFLCIVLIVAMALCTTGCNDGRDGKTLSESGQAGNAESGKTLGEGSKEFALTVTDQDGNETAFVIHTDQETVGAALSELGVIEGEDSEYGLFVKTVNGITVDFDQDGKYWAFYVDGKYAESGVDVTPVTEGEHYSFQVE